MMIGDIIFVLLVVIFVGFGITLMIEEKKDNQIKAFYIFSYC